MYSCTMPVRDPVPPPPPPQEAVSVLKEIRALYDIASIYSNGLVWFVGGFGVVCGVLRWFGVFQWTHCLVPARY